MRGYLQLFIMSLGLLINLPASAQEKVTLSLEEVWQMAERNYPQTRNPALINEITDLQRTTLQRQYLPQFTLSGQATYQSEVTQVKIPLPGVNVPVLNKDQYKALADLNQLIYDGGLIHNQRAAQQVNGKVEQEKQAVEFYRLKERICQLYMGLLFLNQQLAQVALVEKDLNLGVARAEAQVKNGTAFRSQLLLLKAEVLKAGQRRTELLHARNAWRQALEYYTQTSVAESVQLQEPDFSVQRDLD
ncbi:MAG: TolC family protein [Chitinophagaceae bacterium]